ncbi:M28 family peptidase [Sphingosinicella sp. LHD-64]|uniref:M28 family peptidase n=1 Tax=Sphingosinicella sp. LHD-64 TaxID=3072139 RepID=UPI002810283F|nr:M28 family peptidase [Sphingosinicella sp. LHD-64]MDQ8755176.1 M28 family peptidase [Sphingosinicella sp. LHD-64]
MVRRGLALILVVAALLAAMALKGALIALPAPPAGASDGFDANRAAARLARILGDERPHPVDSPANDAVRDRLIAEMHAVGLNPRITDDFACNGFARSRTVSCARVRNLVATIGPVQGRHLLLNAHYDSTFAGPGAGDDGIGVATLLETAALLRGRRLTRPVTFLFNEGEEMGLIGARAFMDRDPLADRVGLLVNLEARGVTGPAVMFETNRPNTAAIALYRAAVNRPLANSLTTDLYGLIPNSTDVTVFAERPWTILNFAIIGNETRYHSAGDNLAALDRRSLQHMGEQTLALTRAVAIAGATPSAGGARLYMDVLGRQLVVLPLAAGLALLGLLLAFFAVTSWRRAALQRPLAAIVTAFATAQVLAWLGQLVLGLVRSGDYWRAWPIVTTTAVYASAIAGILLALGLVARDSSIERLRAAYWLAFAALGAALAVIAPGGSIFFLAPPLAMALGIVASRRWPHTERIGAIIAILLLYITFGPALGLFEELMNGGPHFMFAPLGAVLVLPVLIELKPLIDRIPRIFLAAGAADLVLLGWLAAGLAPAYSADRQQQFTIDYVWDADARSGHWTVNNDGAPVPYVADWARIELPHSQRKRWATTAPSLPLPPPAAILVAQRAEAGGRRLTLRLAANGAETISLIAPPEAVLRAAGSAGFLQPFGRGDADDRWIARCVGRSCDGALIEIVAQGQAPIEFTIVGTRSGLPPAAAPLVRARPAHARPQYGTDSTVAYARLRL